MSGSYFYVFLFLVFTSSSAFQHKSSPSITKSLTTFTSSSSSTISDRYYSYAFQLFASSPSLTPPPNRKGPADNDFISSFFSKFLPTPEDIGLSRFDSNSRPENYPCTKSEWASLLPQDIASKDNDLILIRQLLAKTNLETRPLQCIYDANRDGWKAKVFHEKVDKKGSFTEYYSRDVLCNVKCTKTMTNYGPALVYCKSVSGGVFGGYNPTGWVNYGEYRGSIAAFLYQFTPDAISSYFTNFKNPNTNYQLFRPYKLAKISGAGLAQIDDGSGPKFGAEGLTIPLQLPKSKLVRSKLGLYYERLPFSVENNSLLPNNNKEDELCELKAYVGIYSADEKIPYSDALPFSLN